MATKTKTSIQWPIGAITPQHSNEQLAERAAIEAERGIFRNEAGEIIRSKEWKKERVAFLKGKVEDYQDRIKSGKKQIADLEADIKSSK